MLLSSLSGKHVICLRYLYPVLYKDFELTMFRNMNQVHFLCPRIEPTAIFSKDVNNYNSNHFDQNDVARVVPPLAITVWGFTN